MAWAGPPRPSSTPPPASTSQSGSTCGPSNDPEQAARLLDEVGLTGRDRDGFRTFPDGSNLTIQIAARTGGPVDISKLFELEIAQWTEVDLRVAPRLVDDAAWGENGYYVARPRAR